MNDSYDPFDLFSNSFSSQKSLLLNLVTLADLPYPLRPRPPPSSSHPLPSSSNPLPSSSHPSHLPSSTNVSTSLVPSSFIPPPPSSSSGSPGNKSVLDEIFRCFICFARVKNAQMCPNCSKLCCGGCIRRWLTEQKAQCPHCRSSLRVSQLVNCRFVGEITNALDSLGIKKEEEDELCKVHRNKLMYFCKNCDESVCADCAMLGGDHKGHEFEHINKIYEFHVSEVLKEAEGLKNKLGYLKENLEKVQNSIEAVKKAKEEKQNEINAILEQMSQKLDSELKSRLVLLISQKNSITDEIDLLSNIKNDMDRQLNESPKNLLISKSTEMVQMLKEINKKKIESYENPCTLLNFKSEIVPEYDSGSFILEPFNILRKSSEIVYSDYMVKNGLTWRLKIYPNGNGVAKNTYLSIFLELVKGLHQSAKYEYRIEMLNHRNSENVIIREFASDFEAGECWGYNRFFKLEFLEKDGYLDPETEAIHLKYYVRPQNYYQKCLDLEMYVKKLELQLEKKEEGPEGIDLAVKEIFEKEYYQNLENHEEDHEEQEENELEENHNDLEKNSSEKKEIANLSSHHSLNSDEEEEEEEKDIYDGESGVEENFLEKKIDNDLNHNNNNQCIFETGSLLLKDSLMEAKDNQFIPLDEICEKTGGKREMNEELSSDENFTHIRNLLPNFEIEAAKKLPSSKIETEEEDTKKKGNSIVLSENLIKKLENMKLITQKVKRTNEQKENSRTQDDITNN